MSGNNTSSSNTTTTSLQNGGNPSSKKKPKQIDFIVNTGNPNDASSKANKKRVRSVAALKSWPERRKKIFEQLESSTTGGQGAFLVESEPSTLRIQQPISSSSTTAASASPGNKRQSTSRTSSHTSDHKVAGPAPPAPPPALAGQPTFIGLGAGSSIALYHDALARAPVTKAAVSLVHAFHPDTPCQCTQCRNKRRVANTPLGAVSSTQYVAPARRKRLADGSEKEMPFSGDMAMLTPPSSPAPSPSRGRGDPFNCYPVPYQPWFDHILHHSKSSFRSLICVCPLSRLLGDWVLD